MSEELFHVEESLSPMRLWIKEHDIRVHYTAEADEDQPDDSMHLPWCAWLADNDCRSGACAPEKEDACGYGLTEADALIDLCVKHKIAPWQMGRVK